MTSTTTATIWCDAPEGCPANVTGATILDALRAAGRQGWQTRDHMHGEADLCSHHAPQGRDTPCIPRRN